MHSRFFQNFEMFKIRMFLFILSLTNALLTSNFVHNQSHLNIHSSNVFCRYASALLEIYYLEFYFIYSAYLDFTTCQSGVLGGPHIFTLFIRSYYISDDG